jgi:hypothetical protein
MFTKTRMIFFIASLIFTLLLSPSCTPATQTLPTPSITPPPNFIGRFLLLNEQNGEIAIYELNFPMEQPNPLWVNFPGSTLSAVISSDGHFVFLLDSQVMVDLTNGDSVQLALGDMDFAIFSPENIYLAYGTNGNNLVAASIHVINLTTQVNTILYEGTCADYIGKGILCGRIEGIHWIDKNTLVYSAFFGDMPLRVFGPPYEVNANHTAVVTTQGKILNEFNMPRLHNAITSGSTVVIDDNDGTGSCSWLSAPELLAGTPQPHPFTGVEKSIFTDFLPCPILSPDGQSALFIDINSGSWQILNLSTWEVSVSYPSLTSCDDLVWSPDMSQVACLNGDRLGIISPNTTTQSILLDKATYDLLAWLP